MFVCVFLHACVCVSCVHLCECGRKSTGESTCMCSGSACAFNRSEPVANINITQSVMSLSTLKATAWTGPRAESRPPPPTPHHYEGKANQSVVKIRSHFEIRDPPPTHTLWPLLTYICSVSGRSCIICGLRVVSYCEWDVYVTVTNLLWIFRFIMEEGRGERGDAMK